MSDPDARLTAWVHGDVQGWVSLVDAVSGAGARPHRVRGQPGRRPGAGGGPGPREAGEKLLELLQGGASWPAQPGRVDKVVADWSQPQERFEGFVER